MICWVVHATGWTWDYIEDHVTMPRLGALSRYFDKNPPVGVSAWMLARGFLDIKPVEVESDIEKLIAETGTHG